MLGSIVSPLDGFRSPFGPPRGFNPARLFGATDTGWLYDPSDMSTLFQDAAGTTPVTAVGQPVGLMLDKSGRGNHRSQSVSLNRPTYARHPLGGIRNLLRFTEEFDNPAWAGTVTVTPNVEVAPDGSTTADLLTAQVILSPNIKQDVALSAGQHTVSFWVKAGTSTSVSFGMFLSGFISGTASIISGPGSVSGSSLIALSGLSTSLWTRVQFAFTATASSPAFYIYPEGTGIGTGKTAYVWGTQLEVGSTATAYQRVVSAFDVTEAGVPDLYYLSYDGWDDFLSTAPFAWGSDKATICVGVRKLSDANRASVVESGVNQPSSIRLEGPPFAGGLAYGFGSSGTVPTFNYASSSGFAAPISNVITGLGDISGDRATLRVNGAQVAQSTDDQGTGNYGTYQAFFGARGGTSLFFRGSEYPSFGINRLLTANELDQLERWTAQRTGVTL